MWLLVRKALLPGSTVRGRSTPHHQNTASEDGLVEDNRAGGLGTGPQGQHLSARTWLWEGWVLAGPQDEE